MSPLEQDLIDLMLDEVTIAPKTGIDAYNNFTFGPAVTVQCQITRANRRALDRSGREVTSRVQVILATPELHVGVDDRLTLPGTGPITDRQPPIIEVLAASDQFGPYFLEVRA